MKFPQNIELEEAVLGEIIYRGEQLQDIIEVLQPDDFYKTINKTLYKEMLECYDKNIPITLLSLADHLNEKKTLTEIGGVSYLMILSELASGVPNITLHYVKKIIEARKKRGVLTSIITISRDIYSSWEDVQKAVEKQLLDSVFEINTKTSFSTIKERLPQITEQAQWYYDNKGKNIGLNIGLPNLIRKCPILLKDYVILAGASRLGKTILAMNMVYRVAQIEGKHTAFLSCEMAREEIELRLKSLHSGYSTDDIMRGRVHPENLKLDMLKEMPILVAEFGSTQIDKIRNSLRLLKKKYPDLCFVAIDAINFISDKSEKNERSSKAQEVSSISGKLRDLAQHLDIAILLICQIPKSTSGRRPVLEDIKDSGSLGYDADTVWFLYWDVDKFLKEQAEAGIATENIKVQLLVEKQRRGMWGMNDYLEFIPKQMYFGEPKW